MAMMFDVPNDKYRLILDRELSLTYRKLGHFMKLLINGIGAVLRKAASATSPSLSALDPEDEPDITGIQPTIDPATGTLWWLVQVRQQPTDVTFQTGYINSQDIKEDTVSSNIITNTSSYLDDDGVVLSRDSIDLLGAKTYNKSANVPSDYVVELQKDLTTLGFKPGTPDGFFGHNTSDVLKAFQEAALGTSRMVDAASIIVTPTYRGDAHGECDEETRQEIKLWLQEKYRWVVAPAAPAVAIPPKNVGVPFAIPTTPAAQYWPIITRNSGGREVAYEGTTGKIYGRSGRRFLADRPNARYHVGVDLWGDAGDIIVACEAGTIVNHYHFYNGVHALFEQCDSGVVINYGEVKPGSWRDFGVDIGSHVVAGQPIARVGQMKHSAMCHFEMYTTGTKQNQRYYKRNRASPPANLLDPTQYLLALASKIAPAIGAAAPLPAPHLPLNPTPDFSGMELLTFHNAFPGGVRWRLTHEGIEIEGAGVERTRGEPKTITNIWTNYSAHINTWATHFNVPCVVIVAIIAVESSGDANSLRKEPGYISDSETPHKISPGLMQTLISTAQSTLKATVPATTIDRAWLLNPSHSIQAGTSYISGQRSKTLLDPPKVACAYNAGSVYENKGRNNRWKMRQYPIGTSEHCDRFVKWFNDAVEVLETSATRPSVPYDVYFS